MVCFNHNDLINRLLSLRNRATITQNYFGEDSGLQGKSLLKWNGQQLTTPKNRTELRNPATISQNYFGKDFQVLRFSNQFTPNYLRNVKETNQFALKYLRNLKETTLKQNETKCFCFRELKPSQS